MLESQCQGISFRMGAEGSALGPLCHNAGPRREFLKDTQVFTLHSFSRSALGAHCVLGAGGLSNLLTVPTSLHSADTDPDQNPHLLDLTSWVSLVRSPQQERHARTRG